MWRAGEPVVLLMAVAAACSSSGCGAPAAGGAPASRDAASDAATASSADATEVGGGDVPASVDGPADASPSSDAGPSLRLAVPLYVWPGEGDAWAQVAAAGRAVSYIVANAGDPGGPGPSADPAYTTAIANAHTAGQRVLGYVDTSFATRALAAVLADIDLWYAFYPAIDGIFLDQTPPEAATVASYFKPASDHVRGKPGPHVVVINPGQPDFAESYMTVADVAMSYENPYGSAGDGYGPGQYAAPPWLSNYPAERFWHVILEVPAPMSMHQVLDLARARNAGHVYVTNYADPPAYARLPTYFADELAALAR